MVSDDFNVVRCKLAIAEVILDYTFVSKINVDTLAAAGGSDRDSSGESCSEGEEESSDAFAGMLSFPYFETKAQDTIDRNRKGRFTTSLEALQDYIFNSLEMTLNNMCIIWHISALISAAELRVIQNEMIGSMSYWKEAKNL